MYLGVVNSRLDQALKDTIVIDAKLRKVVDVGIDHGFPVPARYDGLNTLVTLDLPPGDGTILDLGLEADMRREIRPLADLPMDDPTPVPGRAFDGALERLRHATLEPEARREAFALVSIGKRYFSHGAYGRAKWYLDRGLAVRKACPFVKIEGDDVQAVRTAKPVKLDGVLDEWASVRKYSLKGSATSGGAFMCMWDPATIYVAVVVRDKQLKEAGELGTGVNWRWGFDGAILRLGASDTCARSPRGFVDVQLEDGYSVAQLAVSGRKCAYPSVGVSPANVRFAVKRIDGGYVMEAALPAQDYMILPLAGASIGFDVQLSGATGTFCQYSKREGMTFDGLRLGRLYFRNAPTASPGK